MGRGRLANRSSCPARGPALCLPPPNLAGPPSPKASRPANPRTRSKSQPAPQPSLLGQRPGGRSQVTQGPGRAEAEARQPRPRAAGQPRTRGGHRQGSLPRRPGAVCGGGRGEKPPREAAGKGGVSFAELPMRGGVPRPTLIGSVAGGVNAVLLNPGRAPGTAGLGAHSVLRWLQTPPWRISHLFRVRNCLTSHWTMKGHRRKKSSVGPESLRGPGRAGDGGRCCGGGREGGSQGPAQPALLRNLLPELRRGSSLRSRGEQGSPDPVPAPPEGKGS